MRTQSSELLMLAALATLAGCGGAVAGPSGAVSSRGDALVTQNFIGENFIGENFIGENFIGENFIGENFFGENFIGENSMAIGNFVVSVDISPVHLAHAGMIRDVHLEAANFVGSKHGTTYSGDDFVGAEFSGTLANGLHAQLRVTQHTHAAAPNSDLDLYMVEWRGGPHNQNWQPLCPDVNGIAQYATATYGYWDYTQGTPTGGDKTQSTSKFTFACTFGAIGKCILWGYRPWSTYNGISLEPYHQTCTRMTRADYCGDGKPHTVDGAWINLYDNQGINTDDASWIMEAKWSPDGATCLAPGGITDGGAAVSCYAKLASSSCGTDDSDAMLTTETPYGERSTRPPPP